MENMHVYVFTIDLQALSHLLICLTLTLTLTLWTHVLLEQAFETCLYGTMCITLIYMIC